MSDREAGERDRDLARLVREIAREEAKAVVAQTLERLVDDVEAEDRARRQ